MVHRTRTRMSYKSRRLITGILWFINPLQPPENMKKPIGLSMFSIGLLMFSVDIERNIGLKWVIFTQSKKKTKNKKQKENEEVLCYKVNTRYLNHIISMMQPNFSLWSSFIVARNIRVNFAVRKKNWFFSSHFCHECMYFFQKKGFDWKEVELFL